MFNLKSGGFMICKKCGQKMPEVAAFCSSCGAKLSSKAVADDAEEQTQKIQNKKIVESPVKTTYSEKSQVITKILIVLGIFGVHNFYVGKTVKGFCQLIIFIFAAAFFGAGSAFITSDSPDITIATLFFVLGGCLTLGLLIWVFLDFLKVLDGRYTDKNGAILRPPVMIVRNEK